MKKISIIITFCFLALTACQSIESYNNQLQQPIPVDKLHKDVDYSYKKLKQLHPKLYWYISKEKLDYKIDSLKQSIKQPMTGLAFYKELSPVLRSIGQGHLGISPTLKKLSKKELKLLKKRGKSPFNQLELEFIDNKLIILKNRSRHTTIKEAAEILSINNEYPTTLIEQYKRRVASDGYNQTFYNRYLGKYFGTFYTIDKGKIQDSLQLVIRQGDKDSLYVIKRDTFGTNTKENKVKLSKAEIKKRNKIWSKHGYNKDTKTNTRDLKYIGNDSITALLTIKQFSNGGFQKFYEDSFNELAKNGTQNLIIDLRNNPGGRLMEIEYLYSYLVDKPYVFIDEYEVVSRTSKLHADYFKGGGPVVKFFKIVAAPIYYSVNYLKVRKEGDRYISSNSFSKENKPKPNNFKGKIYVLINGGSFSASSIISSNLKSTKRAFFVGEETGGAYNGTVAAQMPLVQLPNSKVNLRIGLALVSASHKTSEMEGRGIFPDKEIIPTYEDRKNNIDPELNWILQDIKSEKEAKELLKKNLQKSTEEPIKSE